MALTPMAWCQCDKTFRLYHSRLRKKARVFDLTMFQEPTLDWNTCRLGSIEYFKITFVIPNRIPDRILRIVKSERIVIHLYLLAMNLNTNKPIDIGSRPNINE